MGNRQNVEFLMSLEGTPATFSVDVLQDGCYRLQVKTEAVSVVIDMSQGQYDSLGAAHNDADGQVRGFVGQEFGDE